MSLSSNQKAQIAILRSLMTDADWAALPTSDATAISLIAQYSAIKIADLQAQLADFQNEITNLQSHIADYNTKSEPVQALITLLQTPG